MSKGSRVSRLESALTRRAPVTPLSSTLTRPSRKNIKTRDFNSISCHTYEGSPRKSFRCHTYKKGVGVASDFCEGRSGRPQRFLRVPIPSGWEGVRVANHELSHESRSESKRMHKAVVN